MNEKNVPMRDKYWNEMDDAQKIAALQEAIVWMARDFMALQESVAKLGQHSHDSNGGIVAPLRIPGHGGMNESGYRPDYARRLKQHKD